MYLLLELLRSRAMDSKEWGQWVDEYPIPQGEAEHTTGPRNLRKRNMGSLASRYEVQSFSFIQLIILSGTYHQN